MCMLGGGFEKPEGGMPLMLDSQKIILFCNFTLFCYLIQFNFHVISYLSFAYLN